MCGSNADWIRSRGSWLPGYGTCPCTICGSFCARSSGHGAGRGGSSFGRSVPASMSPDETILAKVLRAFEQERLEAILVGNAAAALQGAPVMTQDLDFFVRATVRNEQKLARVAKRLGLSLSRPFQPVSEIMRAEGREMVLDFVFRLGPGQSFEGVRSRAVRIPVGAHRARVARLEDVIRAKRAANRPRDRAALPLLEETLQVRKALRPKP